MNEQAIRFRLGIFVLGALLLLGVLIILFGGYPTYFKPSNHFTIMFDNAPGISAGTPVRRSGVKIGEVRKVTLEDDTGKVRIEISVDQDHTVRKQDEPTLVQGLLGGDTSIDFVQRKLADGKPAPDGAVEPGATLDGKVRADAGSLVQQTAEVMPPAKQALEEAKKTIEHYDKLTPLLQEVLKEYRELGKTTRGAFPDFRRTNEELQLAARNWSKVGERFDVLLLNNEEKVVKALDRLQDTLKRLSDVFNDENQKNLSLTLKNVRSGSDRLDKIAGSTEDLLKDSQAMLKRVNKSLERSDEVLQNMEKITKPMAQRSEKILLNLEESTDKLNLILGDLRGLLQTAGRADGTLQRLLNDPTLYTNVSESTALLNRILPRVDRAMRDLEIFADKIARHPEALGLGGLVRPGTGLKGPPTVLPWKGMP
jgi:phospholipid/cholesterol/gamma-HCH transport system substrate-binding protein